MTVLLDTNVLVRLDHVGNPGREIAGQAIERLIDLVCDLLASPSVIPAQAGIQCAV